MLVVLRALGSIVMSAFSELTLQTRSLSFPIVIAAYVCHSDFVVVNMSSVYLHISTLAPLKSSFRASKISNSPPQGNEKSHFISRSLFSHHGRRTTKCIRNVWAHSKFVVLRDFYADVRATETRNISPRHVTSLAFLH